MAKISINIDDITLAWIAAKQKETGNSRTDVILAVLKACQASENAPPAPLQPVPAQCDQQPTSEPTNDDMAAVLFTLDTFFQRYITDHPMEDRTAIERWETFLAARQKKIGCAS